MKLLQALHMEALDRPPIWFMRQAGRYLPEYLDLRAKHSFQEAVHSPDVAAEITLQPIRRFGLDAAIIFSDIMTPLEAMGIEVEFTPGPYLAPMSNNLGYCLAVEKLMDIEVPEKVKWTRLCYEKVMSGRGKM